MDSISVLIKVICCGSCLIGMFVSIVLLLGFMKSSVDANYERLTALDIYRAMHTEDGFEP